MPRVLEYFCGYVWVEVRGQHPERLINLCSLAGFPVWDVRTVGGKVQFATTVSKYREIRPLARKARCVPKVRARVGLPFVMAKVAKRPAFVWPGFLMLGLLLYLSGCVWLIEVRGNVRLERSLILDVVRQVGLKPGARKVELDPREIELALTMSLPELSWAYVRFVGTKAVIQVVEKTRPQASGPGDIVAKKSGLIESLLVLSGLPIVAPGQLVKAGQPLVVGNPAGAIEGARARVLARTWYQVTVEVPLVARVPARTGRVTGLWVLRVDGREYGLFGTRALYEWYEVEDYPVLMANVSSSQVKLLSRRFYEVVWVETVRSGEEAEELGKRIARETIERQLPSSVRLIDFKYMVGGDDTVRTIKATAECVEDIAELKPWSR